MSVVDITILILKLIVAALQLLDAVLKYLSNSDSSRTEGERATAPLSPYPLVFRFPGMLRFYDTLNDA